MIVSPAVTSLEYETHAIIHNNWGILETSI